MPHAVPASRLRRLAAHLGLDSRPALSWALYDWANSAFATTIMAAVLPIYYQKVAAADLAMDTGQAANIASVYWGYTTAIGLLVIALISPLLGALADLLGTTKRFMAAFVVLGVSATACLYFVGRGDWLFASVLFVVANAGFAGANVFYDALLPAVASRDKLHLLSTAGYALGYLGGGLLIVLNAWWIVAPQAWGIPDGQTASRLAMLSVAVWWALFSVPLFRNVPEPPRQGNRNQGPEVEGRQSDGSVEEVVAPAPSLRIAVGMAFRQLVKTIRLLPRYPDLALFLVAFWLYSDGIGTIIKLGAIYASELGLGQSDLLGAIILIQFAGVPFAFAFGALASRIGSKRALLLSLAIYVGITLLAYNLHAAWQFWLVAFLIATVQGGSQGLSRSVFTTLIPAGQTAELFGFFSISEKFAGILGPLLFAVIGQATGNSRLGILSLVAFFIIGALLLGRVDLERGQRRALTP